MWEFDTDPEFQEKLDWMARLVRSEIEPLDALWADRLYERPMHDVIARIVRPLQAEVKKQGLWACHLGPALGGPGFGQLKLALMNEILGRSVWAPLIFGAQPPDTGNSEILAHFGTPAQKERYLRPLLEGEIVSCYSMTEPHGGADPKVFTTTATRDGDEWVINGAKFFSSNARWASFFLVMAITDPDVEIYRGASIFIVPAGTPGIVVERNPGLLDEGVNDGAAGLVRYTDCRVPADHLLGAEGQGFGVAQTRLGGGRIHHAMRTVGQAQLALDMMTERCVSRHTQGTLLGEKQAVQVYLADSYAEIMQFRLFVLYVAWKIDKLQDYGAVRKDISAIKVLTAQVLHNVVQRAIQVHGALGVTNELPLAAMWQNACVMGLVDGPSEVHRTTVARSLLKEATPAQGPWPSEWLPAKRDSAEQRIAKSLGVGVEDLPPSRLLGGKRAGAA